MKTTRTYTTSFGRFVFGNGNEVALITNSNCFVGVATSKGIEAQANRFSGMKKDEISELMTKAWKEAIA